MNACGSLEAIAWDEGCVWCGGCGDDPCSDVCCAAREEVAGREDISRELAPSCPEMSL